MNEHKKAIDAAEKTTKELHKLFAKLGTKEHPRGRIISAYRVARKAIKSELEAGNRAAVLAILQELRYAISAATNEILLMAAELGISQAEAEMAIYGLRAISNIDAQPIQSGVDMVLAQVDWQIKATEAVLATGGAIALVVGDKSRVGFLSAGSAIREAAKWTTTVAMQSLTSIIDRPDIEPEYHRQAIAAIDERTTDCCLSVHGQTQPIGQPFKLTGTPRYADELEHSPFHNYCRTSIALVPVRLKDDDLTREMRYAAQFEKAARIETGTRVEIHPSDAFSRR